MLEIRHAEDRGHSQHGWLDSWHTFSFADYYDPRQMGFRALRVINQDRVEAGKGFGAHSHRSMEIVSYVVAGALEHKDSMGTGSVIRPGEVQLMSAGTGVMHSEMNASKTEPVHFLQIWIVPSAAGGAPTYQQRDFPEAERRGTLRALVSPDGRDDSLRIRQDASIFGGLLAPDQSVTRPIAKGRHVWVQVVRGALAVNEERLDAGDGAALTNETELRLTATTDAEVLVFDLP
jgi:redox-sensitive bicupin YhaK (pirin superfamily)